MVRKVPKLALQPKRSQHKDDPRLSLRILMKLYIPYIYYFLVIMLILSYLYVLKTEIAISVKIKVMNTPNTVCPKLVYQCRKQPVFAYMKIFFIAFFNWNSLHARLHIHYNTWSYQKKMEKKMKSILSLEN